MSGLNSGRVGIMCEASRDGKLHCSRYDTGGLGDLDYVGGAGVTAARLYPGNKPKLSPAKPMQSNQFNSSV